MMKKLLLTSIALAIPAGFATAQTTVQSCDREVTFDTIQSVQFPTMLI